MGKGYRENADYFVEDGKDEGRRGYARQKAKLTRGTAASHGSKEPSRHPDARLKQPFSIPGPIAGGTETMRIAQEKRKAKARKKTRKEATERMLSTAAPAPDPSHALPPASRQTLLSDLVRDIQEHATIAGRAARELYGSVGSLVRAPGRLLRVIWLGQRANA